jgi:WD40 repeat protein
MTSVSSPSADAIAGVQFSRPYPGVDFNFPMFFSPDGRWLALGSTSYIFVFDAATLTPRMRCPTGLLAGTYIFAPDGNSLAATAKNAALFIWQLPAGEHNKTLSFPDQDPRRLAFSPDGQRLAIASDRQLSIYRLIDGQAVWSVPIDDGIVTGLTFTSDGQTLIVTDQGVLEPHRITPMAVRIWQANDGKLIERREGPFASLVVVSQTGRWYGMRLTRENAIQVLPVSDSSITAPVSIYPAENVTALTFSPKDDLLVGGDKSGTISIWETRTGKLRRTFAAHTSTIFGVAISPDGTILATVSSDGTLRLWRL